MKLTKKIKKFIQKNSKEKHLKEQYNYKDNSFSLLLLEFYFFIVTHFIMALIPMVILSLVFLVIMD